MLAIVSSICQWVAQFRIILVTSARHTGSDEGNDNFTPFPDGVPCRKKSEGKDGGMR